MNLVDPCEVAELIIHPDTIINEFYYAIFSTNEAVSVPLYPSKIDLSTGASVCPAIQIEVENADGTALNNAMFSYDQAHHRFICDTREISLVGTYEMKVVASFMSEIYIQTS